MTAKRVNGERATDNIKGGSFHIKTGHVIAIIGIMIPLFWVSISGKNQDIIDNTQKPTKVEVTTEIKEATKDFIDHNELIAHENKNNLEYQTTNDKIDLIKEFQEAQFRNIDSKIELVLEAVKKK